MDILFLLKSVTTSYNPLPFFFSTHPITIFGNNQSYWINTISNMGRYGSHSIIGTNFKHLNRKYYMDERNVYSNVCDNNEEVIRSC